MDNHEQTKNSTMSPPPEFEFGSLTPSSPSQDSFAENSPADHLFFNGRLLPHTFPMTSNDSSKRSISRTTSEYTSRSNSTNSRSSFSCSSSSSNSSSSSHSPSPRTSSFNGNNCLTNHKPLDLKLKPTTSGGKSVNTTTATKSTEVVAASLYRSYSSQRWQYITPAPVKKKSSGGGIRVGGRRKKAARMKKKEKVGERRRSRVMKWWRRILMAAVFACKECHALEGA